jgi:hypothetical protein
VCVCVCVCVCARAAGCRLHDKDIHCCCSHPVIPVSVLRLANLRHFAFSPVLSGSCKGRTPNLTSTAYYRHVISNLLAKHPTVILCISCEWAKKSEAKKEWMVTHWLPVKYAMRSKKQLTIKYSVTEVLYFMLYIFRAVFYCTNLLMKPTLLHNFIS